MRDGRKYTSRMWKRSPPERCDYPCCTDGSVLPRYPALTSTISMAKALDSSAIVGMLARSQLCANVQFVSAATYRSPCQGYIDSSEDKLGRWFTKNAFICINAEQGGKMESEPRFVRRYSHLAEIQIVCS